MGLAALALGMVLVSSARAAPPCPGESTVELNQCYADRLSAANATLGRYQAAVRKRLRDDAAAGQPDDKSAADALRGFATAEALWEKYRDAECGAVYDYWSGGTIRGVESLTCSLRITTRHTHTIWALWLTYMDSTPPILPEPPTAEPD